ncbi:endonuclease/exonuclease/phosphatase family protein [Micromonospora sp. NBC_01699]|uniref:endonuclease/exonuclease/phosphatase family protein n=1 Tax=Micromonospora sp. NBC_01699 TaxID=2975984 RepID=UPI002E319671|nr:endonuclease/exonuclease/phosphatase family protein [Micromonospora sp. NBC_01699]
MTVIAPEAPVRQPAPPARRRGWRWWLYSALVAAGALWLAFVVAHLVLSGQWWLWLAVDAIPPVFFLVIPVLLAVGAAPCRRSRGPVALLAAAALLLGAPLSGINVQRFGGGDGPAPADAIRVFSWNTGYWDEGGETEALYRTLREADADIYLLQEYWYEKTPEPLDPTATRLRAEFPGFHIAIIGELITVSRFPILRQIPLDAPDLPPPTAGSTDHWLYKSLRTDLDLGSGRVLSTYNVHLPVQLSPEDSPLDPDFYLVVKDQRAQREPQFRALAADVATNDNAVLVAGDLNTSPAMGDVRKLPESLRDASYAMSSLYPTSWAESSNWPRWWRLDWAFVSPDVRVHSYEFRSARGLSDHRSQELVISTG